MSEEKDVDIIQDVSLVDILDVYSVEKNNEQYGGVRVKSPLRPSSSGKCERALAHEYQEFHNQIEATVEQKEANVVRLLKLGHYIERALISDLYGLRDTFDIHVKYKDQIVTVGKLNDGTFIQGEIDFCLEGPDFKLICDAKSTKVKFHSHFKDSWDDITKKWDGNKYTKKVSETCYLVENTYDFVKSLKDDFKINNIMQLNGYAHAHFFEERGYEWCSLFYYLKNCSRLFELRFKKCKKLHNEVMAKFQSAYDNGKDNPLNAEKTFKLGSIRCAFCPYNKSCWSEDSDPKYAFFKTLPKKAWPKDLDRLKESDKLEELFDKYEECLTQADEAVNIEEEITTILYDQKVRKVKLKNGNIWIVKPLKDGLRLRRGKL